MLTSKQRSVLRSKANAIDAIIQIGKGGISEGILSQINDALEGRELIKITVLKNCEFTAKDLMNDLCKTARCEPVQCVGAKLIVYRKSVRKDFKHIDING